jgi:hypothetical protein
MAVLSLKAAIWVVSDRLAAPRLPGLLLLKVGNERFVSERPHAVLVGEC